MLYRKYVRNIYVCFTRHQRERYVGRMSNTCVTCRRTKPFTIIVMMMIISMMMMLSMIIMIINITHLQCAITKRQVTAQQKIEREDEDEVE